jgi:conjugal transfer pilus assembly protein TraW
MKQWVGKLLIRIIIFSLVFLFFKEVFPKENSKILSNTYEIAEPDAYEEILNAVKRVNIEKYKKMLQEKIRKHAVVDEFKIPYAKETRTRYFEPRYELPFDIVDANGRVIYPKGFTFNPLQYMTLHRVLILFDAKNALHLNWLKNDGYTKRWDVMFIAVKGDIVEAQKILKIPVYKASKGLLERFDVKRIPSIIRQDGNKLEITEVGTKDVERSAYKQK